MMSQETIEIRTRGRGTYEISNEVQAIATKCKVNTGLCHLFVQHTSASLMICENADPQVLVDLEAYMARLVPDGDNLFQHTAEGPDDMPAHVRSVLTQASLTIPIHEGRCLLGTWQGVYLWEHRTHPHTRRIIVSIFGE